MLVVTSDSQSLYDGTSGINSVRFTDAIDSKSKNSKYIYGLNGQNMGTDASALPKGVYIINGKKVVK